MKKCYGRETGRGDLGMNIDDSWFSQVKSLLNYNLNAVVHILSWKIFNTIKHIVLNKASIIRIVNSEVLTELGWMEKSKELKLDSST